MVVDDDIITSIPGKNTYDGDILGKQYQRVMNGLIKMLTRSLDTFKDLLPQRAKRDHLPHILWIAPPTHKYFSEGNNEKRGRFTSALATVISLHQNMSMLKLVKHWNHDDGNLFLQEQYRYTAEGLTKYWLSVDASIKFWDVAISKKFEKKKPVESACTNVQKETHSTASASPNVAKSRPKKIEEPRNSLDRNHKFDKPRESSSRKYDKYHRQSYDGKYYSRKTPYDRNYQSSDKYGQWYDQKYDNYSYRDNYRIDRRDYEKSSRKLHY